MDREHALTGLEILIFLAVMAGIVASAFFLESRAGDAGGPLGILPRSLDPAEKSLVVAGEIHGHWAQGGSADGVPVLFPPGPSPAVDGISVPVQLIAGSEALDMGSVEVSVDCHGRWYPLPRYEGRPIPRSVWTVSGKEGVLPLHRADEDDFLEPGEIFRILVVPPDPLGPGEDFRLTLAPSGGIPLVIDRGIPARVNPVTPLPL